MYFYKIFKWGEEKNSIFLSFYNFFRASASYSFGVHPATFLKTVLK